MLIWPFVESNQEPKIQGAVLLVILGVLVFYTCANLGTSLRVTTCSGIGRPHSPLGHSL